MSSSMKYINLEGLSVTQIIQKYEELLFQRENMINQLSIQLNEAREKYIDISDKINNLTSRHKELYENKLIIDKALNQQRTDKDLLFIKLNNLISENDKLKNIIQNGGKEIKQQIKKKKKKKKKIKIFMKILNLKYQKKIISIKKIIILILIRIKLITSKKMN